MIEKLKAELATEKIAEFFESMSKLGFKKEEILDLIQENVKGEK